MKNNYEKEIIEFCRERNIPIKKGKVLPIHEGEIINYIRKLVERDKIHNKLANDLKKDKFDIKKLIGKTFNRIIAQRGKLR